ncbi:hypothetical protein OSB04_004141 [Centaurea solstitialis]|uniref:Uncharacterized protein n=1 Tax=Centaurea solstitialis TaxID=347529 RepID=A0AA38WU53_9ASTR|nr:hypothetical protein OSB04_004141 [Centaurea solstitialis]
MAGIALLTDLLKKNPTVNGQTLRSTGLYSATLAASSAAAYAAANAPFASRALFGIGGGGGGGRRVAYCDAGAAVPPIMTDDYLSSLRTASETIFRHDTLNYRTKEYYIELKPLFSAFQPRSFVLTSLRSFLLFYLPLVVPNVEDDDSDDFLPNSSDEHRMDLVVPFKKSVKQILRETTVVTTRRILERLAVHHCSQRVAWKLLKDVRKSAERKASRGMPTHTYFFCVSKTTFRGHFLGVAASWLVQVGIECYRFIRDYSKTCDDEIDDADNKALQVKVLGKKVYGITVRCGASLIFASIGAAIGATLFRPSSGQSVGKHHTIDSWFLSIYSVFLSFSLNFRNKFQTIIFSKPFYRLYS